MNHLKLIIKNSNLATKKVNRFFNKSELRIILNLYSKMVSKGFWKDYGLNISKEEVSFDVYKILYIRFSGKYFEYIQKFRRIVI